MSRRLIGGTAAVALAALGVGAGAGLAATGAPPAYAAPAQQLFVFNGRLAATPGSASTVMVNVTGGNRPALRRMIGHRHLQGFAVDSHTRYLRWAKGVPSVVSEGDLRAGDVVSVRVRADRLASLAQIESDPARVVADFTPPPARRPARPLWLFVGTLKAPVSGGSLSLHVTRGNLRALVAMLGQPQDQMFSYDAHTVFLRWHNRTPRVITPDQLRVGDTISVRVRAPRADTLTQVEHVPAGRVGDHDPAA